jgi:DNA polymerase-1
VPDSEKPTLLVIDGHSLAFRAFYALPVDSFTNREGQHTNAIHGFIAMLINLLRDWKPTHIAIAFDISRYSFRTREYPEYKGTRSETPSEFVGQVPLLQEALHAMNISTITKEDFEADDIMATLAVRGAEEGYNVLIVSGDRDSIQMVNGDVTLLYPNVRGVSELKKYDREAVVERYGIQPEQYPEVAALVGETSDNLIGIDKVGEKTAVKWVLQYGTVDNIVAHADEIKGVVGEKLREQKENALRNRRLNRLVTDVPLPVGPADFERKPINELALREIFGKLEFRTLLDRVLAQEESDGSGGGAEIGGSPESAGNATPAVRTLIDEELGHWIETATAGGTKPLGVQTELGGAGGPGQLGGIGLSTVDDSVYVPWAAGRPDYTALNDWFASDAPKYFFSAKPQFETLAKAGITVNGLAYDTRIAGWLLRPGTAPSSLGVQVYEVLGENLPESDPNQLVPETDPLSPATEAWYVLRVAESLAGALDDGTAKVLASIEQPLVPVIAKMELSGVTVNGSVLAELREELSARIATLEQGAYAEIGHEVNLGSPKQLQQVLFEELGMPKTRSTKTGFSTDAASLTDLQEQSPHPFLGLLLQHRDASKLKQIIETLEKEIDEVGRIHTTYDQAGAATGRMSSNEPNLQNIPVRTEEGRRIRSAFESGKGFETLLTADYSQIEMRIMAHLSGDAGLIQAFNEGEDLHRFVGAHVFGVAPEEVTSNMRTKVKAMSYGLAYGLSAFGLSKQLRIERAEATKLMSDYFERFGAVRTYLRSVVEQARIDGYTETIFGRRRPFPDLTSTNRHLRDNAERAALNSPIQGSAADIMKIAMINVAADMEEKQLESHMLLQVHDELIFEVAPGEWDVLSELVTHRMSTAADLTVPLDVQVGSGPNWDAAAH